MASKRRFSPAQLRAQRAFAARYGGKRSSPRKESRPTMARKSVRSIARSAVGGIRTRSILAGAVAGAASGYASSVAGRYGPAIASAAVGVAMKEPVLQVVAGLQLGSVLSAGLPGAATMPGGLL